MLLFDTQIIQNREIREMASKRQLWWATTHMIACELIPEYQ